MKITNKKNIPESSTVLTPIYRVELIRKNRSHYYKVDGITGLLPGVTGALGIIAKPALIPWAARETAKKIAIYLKEHATGRILTTEEIDKLVEDGRNAHIDIKDKSADLGTRAHQAIDALIKGGEMVITDDIRPCVEAFLSWIGQNSLIIELGDTKVASLVHGYGGSLDSLAKGPNGHLVVLDFKTSNGIWPEYSLQVAAYAQAVKETFDLNYLPECYILRLGKEKAEFEFKKVESVISSFKNFKLALDLHNGMKKQKL